jgi:hypothetical protein
MRANGNAAESLRVVAPVWSRASAMTEGLMPNYYVNSNAQPNSGDHEVHENGCTQGADPENQVPLGVFPSCHGAVAKAKLTYSTANGCAYCCEACNTG